MATVMLYTPTTTITNLTGYAGYGEARVGQGTSVPQAVVGNPTDAAAEYVQWYDVDSSGGLYTATVPVKLDVNLNTGVDTWSVTGGTNDPVRLTDGPTEETVANVEVVAGTQVGALCQWSHVKVQFLQGSVLQESVTPSQDPSVDTRSSGGTEEQIEEIIPSSSTDDEAILTGNIKMLCADGTYPGSDDIFLQAFVFANS
jgi:hypothetical protein